MSALPRPLCVLSVSSWTMDVHTWRSSDHHPPCPTGLLSSRKLTGSDRLSRARVTFQNVDPGSRAKSSLWALAAHVRDMALETWFQRADDSVYHSPRMLDFAGIGFGFFQEVSRLSPNDVRQVLGRMQRSSPGETCMKCQSNSAGRIEDMLQSR